MKSYIGKTSEEIINELEDLKQKTIIAKENNNRDEIKKQISDIEAKWEKINKIWASIVLHQELDNIENALTKAKSNIENGELTDAIEEIETSIFFVNHVKDREKVNLKNIF